MAKKIKRVPNSFLKGLRAERDLSMSDMAKVLGISVTSYLHKENEKIDWKSGEMFTLRKYFDLPLDTIFFGNKVSSITQISKTN